MTTISIKVTQILRHEEGNRNWISIEDLHSRVGRRFHTGPTMEDMMHMFDNYTARYPRLQENGTTYFRLNVEHRHAPHQDGEPVRHHRRDRR